MTAGGKFALVLVTAPDLETARALARAALAARLVACANLVPKVESHYWWQGKLESGAEVLMVLKTTAPRLAALERLIVAKHPYDTPEFVVLPLSGGNERYLAWLAGAVRKGSRRQRRNRARHPKSKTNPGARRAQSSSARRSTERHK